MYLTEYQKLTFSRKSSPFEKVPPFSFSVECVLSGSIECLLPYPPWHHEDALRSEKEKVCARRNGKSIGHPLIPWASLYSGVLIPTFGPPFAAHLMHPYRFILAGCLCAVVRNDLPPFPVGVKVQRAESTTVALPRPPLIKIDSIGASSRHH